MGKISGDIEIVKIIVILVLLTPALWLFVRYTLTPKNAVRTLTFGESILWTALLFIFIVIPAVIYYVTIFNG